VSIPTGGPPYPPSPPYAPVPKRPRPSAWWFALPALLLLLAVAAFPLLILRAIDGLLDTDARFAAEGQHTVTLADTGPRLIWAEQGTYPACVVTDAATGDELALRTPSGTLERTMNGHAEVGWQRFEPISTTVVVTCAGDGSSSISVGPMPDVGGFVGSTLAAIGVPLVLGGLGLISLIVLVILFATGGPRNSRA
jgi:hypothetical protein